MPIDSQGIPVRDHDLLNNVSADDHHVAFVQTDHDALANPHHAELAQATQADMEDEGTTNANRYASPEVLKHSPGVANGWGYFQQSVTHTYLASYNFASITDSGHGLSTHTIDVDMSSAAYAILATKYKGGNTAEHIEVNNIAVGSFTTNNQFYSGGGSDSNGFVAIFGDQ